MKIITWVVVCIAVAATVFIILLRVWILILFAGRFYLDRELVHQYDKCEEIKVVLTPENEKYTTNHNDLFQDLDNQNQKYCQKSWQKILLQIFTHRLVSIGFPGILSIIIGLFIAKKIKS